MQIPERIPEIVPAIELRASYRPSELLRREIGSLVLGEYASRVQDELILRSAVRRVMSEGEYNFESIKDGAVRQAGVEFAQLPGNRHILFDGSVQLDEAPKQPGLWRLELNARMNRTTLAALGILRGIPSLEDEPAYDSKDRARPHAMFVELPKSFFAANDPERDEKLGKIRSGLMHPSGAFYAVPQSLMALRTRIRLKRPDVADAENI